MKFIKVSMKVPSSRCIYAPETGVPETVSPAVDTSQSVQGLVSFAPDGVSNPVSVPLYGHGLDVWYVGEEDI